MTSRSTRRDLYRIGLGQLRAASIAAPDLDARVLLAAALGLGPGDLLLTLDDAIDDESMTLYQSFLNRRCQNEPLSRILGYREFWGLTFSLSPETLDPRADSETLIDGACHYYPHKNAPLQVLDLGTGTGCLMISFLTEYPKSRGVGIDISQNALEMAGKNAADLGIINRCTFIQGAWDQAPKTGFDVIFSNPPYIPKRDEKTLSPEVRLFDPPEALYGGDDGLDAYGAIAPILPSLLNPSGHIFLEIGQGQEEPVTRLMALSNLLCLEWRRDIQGIKRCGVFTHGRP